MRTKIIYATLIIVITLILVILLSGCGQSYVRDFGGTMKLNLPDNTKLESITWKERSLWYLTRPMTENDIAETYTYQQSSEFGIIEGSILITETKTEE